MIPWWTLSLKHTSIDRVIKDLREIPLTDRVTVFGRSRSCTVTIPNLLISRKQCKIVQHHNVLFLKTLGDINLTQINFENVTQKSYTKLSEGDLIAMGMSEQHITNNAFLYEVKKEMITDKEHTSRVSALKKKGNPPKPSFKSKENLTLQEQAKRETLLKKLNIIKNKENVSHSTDEDNKIESPNNDKKVKQKHAETVLQENTCVENENVSLHEDESFDSEDADTETIPDATDEQQKLSCSSAEYSNPSTSTVSSTDSEETVKEDNGITTISSSSNELSFLENKKDIIAKLEVFNLPSNTTHSNNVESKLLLKSEFENIIKLDYDTFNNSPLSVTYEADLSNIYCDDNAREATMSSFTFSSAQNNNVSSREKVKLETSEKNNLVKVEDTTKLSSFGFINNLKEKIEVLNVHNITAVPPTEKMNNEDIIRISPAKSFFTSKINNISSHEKVKVETSKNEDLVKINNVSNSSTVSLIKNFKKALEVPNVDNIALFPPIEINVNDDSIPMSSESQESLKNEAVLFPHDELTSNSMLITNKVTDSNDISLDKILNLSENNSTEFCTHKEAEEADLNLFPTHIINNVEQNTNEILDCMDNVPATFAAASDISNVCNDILIDFNKQSSNMSQVYDGPLSFFISESDEKEICFNKKKEPHSVLALKTESFSHSSSITNRNYNEVNENSNVTSKGNNSLQSKEQIILSVSSDGQNLGQQLIEDSISPPYNVQYNLMHEKKPTRLKKSQYSLKFPVKCLASTTLPKPLHRKRKSTSKSNKHKKKARYTNQCNSLFLKSQSKNIECDQMQQATLQLDNSVKDLTSESNDILNDNNLPEQNLRFCTVKLRKLSDHEIAKYGYQNIKTSKVILSNTRERKKKLKSSKFKRILTYSSSSSSLEEDETNENNISKNPTDITNCIVKSVMESNNDNSSSCRDLEISNKSNCDTLDVLANKIHAPQIAVSKELICKNTKNPILSDESNISKETYHSKIKDRIDPLPSPVTEIFNNDNNLEHQKAITETILLKSTELVPKKTDQIVLAREEANTLSQTSFCTNNQAIDVMSSTITGSCNEMDSLHQFSDDPHTSLLESFGFERPNNETFETTCVTEMSQPIGIVFPFKNSNLYPYFTNYKVSEFFIRKPFSFKKFGFSGKNHKLYYMTDTSSKNKTVYPRKETKCNKQEETKPDKNLLEEMSRFVLSVLYWETDWLSETKSNPDFHPDLWKKGYILFKETEYREKYDTRRTAICSISEGKCKEEENLFEPPSITTLHYPTYDSYLMEWYRPLLLELWQIIVLSFNCHDIRKDSATLDCWKDDENLKRSARISLLLTLHVNDRPYYPGDFVYVNLPYTLFDSTLDCDVNVVKPTLGYVESSRVLPKSRYRDPRNAADQHTVNFVVEVLVRYPRIHFKARMKADITLLHGTREFTANMLGLFELRRSELLNIILSPKVPHLTIPTMSSMNLGPAKERVKSELEKFYSLDSKELQQAYLKIVHTLCAQDKSISIVEGAPGTGKTRLLVWIVLTMLAEYMMISKSRGVKILVCTSSVESLNSITYLIDRTRRTYFNVREEDHFRMVTLAASEKGLTEASKKYLLSVQARRKLLPDPEDESSKIEDMFNEDPDILTAKMHSLESYRENSYKTLLSCEHRYYRRQVHWHLAMIDALNNPHQRNDARERTQYAMKSQKVLRNAHVILTTMEGLTNRHFINVYGNGTKAKDFQRIPICVIDDAHNIPEVQTLLPLVAGVTKIVLAGALTLPQPKSKYKNGEMLGLQNSLLKRIVKGLNYDIIQRSDKKDSDPNDFTTLYKSKYLHGLSYFHLTSQFRMCRRLTNIASHNFGLRTYFPSQRDQPPMSLRPYIVFDHSYRTEIYANSITSAAYYHVRESWLDTEAETAVSIVHCIKQQLREKSPKIEPTFKCIILVPDRHHFNRVNKHLMNFKQDKNSRLQWARCINASLGQEADVIVLCLGESDPITFDMKMLTLAMSRAKMSFIILGQIDQMKANRIPYWIKILGCAEKYDARMTLRLNSSNVEMTNHMFAYDPNDDDLAVVGAYSSMDSSNSFQGSGDMVTSTH